MADREVGLEPREGSERGILLSTICFTLVVDL